MHARRAPLCLLAAALLVTGCIGPLALEDFVDLDDRDGRVSHGPLLRLEPPFAGLPPAALPGLLDEACSGLAADAATLVTGGDRVRLWDARTGTLRASLGAAPDPASDRDLCATDPQRALVAVSDAGSLVVVDLATAETRFALELPRIRALAVAPDGALVAVGTAETTLLLDATSGDALARLDVAPPGRGALAFSPDATRLAAADARDGTLTVWALHALGPIEAAPPHLRFASNAATRTVGWLDDTTVLAAAGRDGDCTTHALELDTLRRTPLDGAPHALCGPPPGAGAWTGSRLEVTAGGDALTLEASPAGLAVTDAATGQLLWERGRAAPVDALAFFDDAPNLLARSADGTVRTWDPTAPDKILLDERDDGRPGAPIAVTDDARQAVYGPAPADLADGAVSTLAVSGASSGNGSGYVAGNQDGELIVKSLVTGRTVARFEPRPLSEGPHEPRLGAIALDDAADHLIAAYQAPSGARGAALVDLGAARIVYELLDGGAASALTFVDGGRYALGHETGEVVLRETSSPSRLDELVTGARVSALGASRDGTRLAVGLADGRIVLWEPASDTRRLLSGGHEAAITALTFSVHDDLLASGDAAGRVVLWSTHLPGEPSFEPATTPAALAALEPQRAEPPSAQVLAAALGRRVAAALVQAVSQRWQVGQ